VEGMNKMGGTIDVYMDIYKGHNKPPCITIIYNKNILKRKTKIITRKKQDHFIMIEASNFNKYNKSKFQKKNTSE
jgi:hypothetical protein